MESDLNARIKEFISLKLTQVQLWTKPRLKLVFLNGPELLGHIEVEPYGITDFEIDFMPKLLEAGVKYTKIS